MSINTHLKIWLVAGAGLFWATPVWADDVDALRKGYEICKRHVNGNPGIAGCADAYEWVECTEIVDRWLTLVNSSANEVESKHRVASAPDEAELANITRTLGIWRTHTSPH